MQTTKTNFQNSLIVTNREFKDSLYDEETPFVYMNSKVKPDSIITDRNWLSSYYIKIGFNPRYIFFPFWSHKVPADIYENFECVMFHASNLPFGRGGSPIQNLISRGIHETQVTAFRCTGEMDAGPIYCKRPVSLIGAAEEILLRIEKIVEEMMYYIVENEPTPKEQEGELFAFKRLGEHDVGKLDTLQEAYDTIRMVDAEGYPRAFIDAGGFRFEFSRASLKRGHVIADVKIRRINE